MKFNKIIVKQTCKFIVICSSGCQIKKLQKVFTFIKLIKTGNVRTYNVTLWHVRLTIVAVETQQCILCVLLSYMSLSTV